MEFGNVRGDLAYRKLKPRDKVQMVSDGGRLYVRVRALVDGGAKSFMFDYRFNGKQRRITLKAKTLADARRERNLYKDMVKQGIDPSLEVKLIEERARAAHVCKGRATCYWRTERAGCS